MCERGEMRGLQLEIMYNRYVFLTCVSRGEMRALQLEIMYNRPVFLTCFSREKMVALHLLLMALSAVAVIDGHYGRRGGGYRGGHGGGYLPGGRPHGGGRYGGGYYGGRPYGGHHGRPHYGFRGYGGAGGYVYTHGHAGGGFIGAVVDPYGWCQQTNDHGHSTGKVEKCPAIADIIVLLDTSSSMSRQEFELEKNFAALLTEHFNVASGGVRFGAVTFSDRVYESFNLASYSSNEAVKTAFRNTAYLAGGTKTYLALDYIRVSRLFSTSRGARDKSSKIVIVLTDGYSDSRSATKYAADALKNTGVKVISVGIGGSLGEELRNMASDGSLVFSADTFQSLTRIEQRVAASICSIPESEGYVPPTDEGKGDTKTCQKGFKPNPKNPSTCIDIDECQTDNPCQQTCVNLPGSVRCTCKADFVINPKDTTKCNALRQCNDLVDIVFLVDESGSIGADNFKLQQTFVAKLTQHFNVGSNGARFAGVQFATQVKKLFDLNKYSSSKDISSALLGTPYGEGGTNTHLGLNYIADNKLFSTASGGRSNAPDVVIVVTDGESSRPDQTKQAADRLKQQGATVVSVGVGDQVKTSELIDIASSKDDVFVVSDFDLLDYIEENLTERICPSTRS